MKDTFFRRFMVLAVNPGSTSTKISVYEGEEERFTKELQHGGRGAAPFEGKPITEQFGFRKDVILQALAENGLSMDDIDAVSGRGGVLHPVPHGTIAVNDAMVHDLRAGTVRRARLEPGRSHRPRARGGHRQAGLHRRPGRRGRGRRPGARSPASRRSADGSSATPSTRSPRPAASPRRTRRSTRRSTSSSATWAAASRSGPTSAAPTSTSTTASTAKGRSRRSAPDRCRWASSSTSASPASTPRPSSRSSTRAGAG